MTTYIDIHVLQTVPPSNINRDDTGSPKTAVFGGVRRARVSSQAWKRAIRADFATRLDASQLGERTFTIVQSVAKRVAEMSDGVLTEQAVSLATKAIKAAGIKVDTKTIKGSAGETEERLQTGALLFASRPQIDALAALIVASPDTTPTKKEAQAALKGGVTVDVALFGRMIADDPYLNIDACAQVAHAVSVHGVDNEYDYYTAVDDNARQDNAGAGMIGTVEFNSSTLYRYATVNVTEFADVLGSDAVAKQGLEVFTRAFVTAMPTGKQNTFANRTMPEFALVVVRDDQPVNLVGAFEDPIEETGGRAKRATQALLKWAAGLDVAYGAHPVAVRALAVGGAREEAERAGVEIGTIDDLVSTVSSAVTTVPEV